MSNTSTQPTVRRRPPGFRFSVTDGGVILLVAAATYFLWPPLGEIGLLFPVVLFHFFLFCNVFRVRRNYELAWAAIFIINFAAWQFAGAFTWPHVLIAQAPVTVAVLAADILSPRYHGIAYARINPNAQPFTQEVQP